MLDYYSSQLSSVEINYSFRRFPSEKTLTTWRDRARPGFVFTLKANQRITHSRRLKDCDDDVRDFLDRAKTLGDRLGCVLFQCPPNLHYDRALIEGFVGYLPPPGTGTRGSRWSSGTRHGWRPETCSGIRASHGASRRPTRRTRPPRRSRGIPPATSACARPSTPTRSCGRGPSGSGRRSPAAPTSSATSSTRTRGQSPQMAKRLEDILRSKSMKQMSSSAGPTAGQRFGQQLAPGVRRERD